MCNALKSGVRLLFRYPNRVVNLSFFWSRSLAVESSSCKNNKKNRCCYTP